MAHAKWNALAESLRAPGVAVDVGELSGENHDVGQHARSSAGALVVISSLASGGSGQVGDALYVVGGLAIVVFFVVRQLRSNRVEQRSLSFPIR